MSSAKQERKKGKWKPRKAQHSVTGEIKDVWVCSECDSTYIRHVFDGADYTMMNFCANCGADMREEADT